MPDTLLHWHCSGITYSVKRMTEDTCYLIITDANGKTRPGRRPIPLSLIAAWEHLPIVERCQHAEGEIERRDQVRS